MSYVVSRLARQGRPSKQDWDGLRPVIENLYCRQGWRLKDVVSALRDQFGFVATQAMYKTRLRLWGLYKNKSSERQRPEPEQERPSSAGSPGWTGVQAVPSPDLNSGSSDQFDSDISAVLIHAPQFQSTIAEASGWTQQQQAGIHHSANASPVISDESSGRWMGFSRITPEASNESREATSAPAVFNTADISHDVEQTSSGSHRLQNTHPSTQDIQHWLSHFPGVVAGAGQRPILPREEPHQFYRMPEARADPTTFIDCISRYCRLSDGQDQRGADASALNGFSVYMRLLREGHRQALTCLNTVMVCVTVFNRREQAVDLMIRARNAAVQVLHSDHPIIHAITFLVIQAGGRNYSSAPIDTLRQAHASMSRIFARNHPNTLVTGYLLAWRLSLDESDKFSQFDAISLLCELQHVTDNSLGPNNLLSIAMLRTKSRALHSRKMVTEAIVNMKDALDRMAKVYHPHHPYVLNARSRLADMLFDAYRDDEAENELLACALGRVEVFGRENSRSHVAIQEVEAFYTATKRGSRRNWFYWEIAQANNRFFSRTATHVHIVDDLDLRALKS